MKSSNPGPNSTQNAIYTIPIREYVDLPASRNKQRQAKKDSCKTFSTINTQNAFEQKLSNTRSKNVSTKNNDLKCHNFTATNGFKLKMRPINSRISSRMKQCYHKNSNIISSTQ